MVIAYVLSVVGCLVVLVAAWGRFRAFVHRVPPARGDRELAAELDRVAGRRARQLAVAVVDLDRESRTAFIGADADTRFEVGSITKVFTGMLLAEAVQRGEVSLDTTVAALAPDIAGSPLGSVTLEELCTHTSGLPRLPLTPGTIARAIGSAWFGSDPYRGSTPEAVLESAKRARLVQRGRQQYSNLGAAVLGQVLARLAGRDFADLLSLRTLGPMRMHATRIADRAAAAPRGWTAAGRRSQAWVMDGYAPAGGVVSTITDMARLVTALLDGSAPGLAALEPLGRFTPDQPTRASGMFWVVDSVPGSDRTMVWHNGQTGGYAAFLALYPQARRAVVVLCNVARVAEVERIAIDLTGWLVRSDPA